MLQSTLRTPRRRCPPAIGVGLGCWGCRSPSPASPAAQERAAAVRGLNGRGWRGGPGPRLCGASSRVAVSGVGIPKGGRGVVGSQLVGRG